MDERRRTRFHGIQATAFFSAVVATALQVGCGPSYRQLRLEGQVAMVNGEYGPARYMLEKAEDKRHRYVENLHDRAVCSVMVAKERFAQMNHAAALRELDAAIDYYSRAIEEHPGHQASLEGKNIALELKGQFEKALRHAEWAAEFVGPSARQFVFLADELEQRGDLDAALLRYRQAVSIEPKNPLGHVAFAKFLMRNQNERAAMVHLAEAYRLNPKDKWVAEQLAAHSAPAEATLASQ